MIQYRVSGCIPGCRGSLANPIPTLTVIHIARLGLLVPSITLFLLPGWILGRMFKTPFAAITPFLGSSALVFNLILLLDALRLPLNLQTVGLSYLVLTGSIVIWATRRGAYLGLRRPTFPIPNGIEWFWLIPPALALTSITARALIEPLIGYDNSFRWDYLARLILNHHTLACYPPVRMADFDLYSWCDGIPPLVPFLNFLIYAAAGSDAGGLISIRAVSEFVLLAALTFRFARDLWGEGAGWPSLAVLGSCTLLVWGLTIEQETGLTAISLVAMVFFLQKPRSVEKEGLFSIFWAAVAAGVGAISREYGLYFVILGALLIWFGGRGRNILRFLVPAMCIASPWLSAVTLIRPGRVRGSSKPATVSGIDLLVERRMPHNGADEPTQSASTGRDYNAEGAGLVRSSDCS